MNKYAKRGVDFMSILEAIYGGIGSLDGNKNGVLPSSSQLQ